MVKVFDRAQRVGDRIQKELAILIQKDMKDPRIGLVTISAVKVSRDLSCAKVYVSAIAEETPLGQLQVVGLSISTIAKGETVSVFGLEKTRKLQTFHEQIMTKLKPYLSYDVSADMVNADQVSESTLLWIRNYVEKAGFAKFLPHITIGFGQVDKVQLPIRFQPSKLAVCHLGNHCTCSRILASVDL